MVFAVISFDAEARRLGASSNIGRQSSHITQKHRAIAQKSTATPTTTSQKNLTSHKQGFSRWITPIAGILAGLGVASLLSHLGLSGAIGEAIFGLAIIAVLLVMISFIVKRLRDSSKESLLRKAYESSYKFTNSEKLEDSSSPHSNASSNMSLPSSLRSAGNSLHVPDDFDRKKFLQQAKENFVRIQKIWDAGDIEGLHECLTESMIPEVRSQLIANSKSNRTEIVLLHAELLGIERSTDGYLASVQFSGLLKEAPNAEASSFEEVWNLLKTPQCGWLLAGIQQVSSEKH